MPISTSTDDNDSKEMEKIVQKALEMLLGAGGHKAGVSGLAGALLASSSSLKNALKVGMGVTMDHWHLGYKDVTMEAFRVGLQRITEDYFIAFKILQNNFYDLQQDHLDKLTDTENRVHILKILGFTKNECKMLNSMIATNPQQAASIINRFINTNREQDYRINQIQKVEFMLNGAQCYLPFAEPNDGHCIKMPMKDKMGQYALVQMQVERINMNENIGGPYYALNLRPTDKRSNENSYSQDLTIFMGTNPLPTASGPSVTVHADTISGMSVGENFVENTRDMFEQLFKSQFKQNLERLLKIANEDKENIYNKDGVINYEKIWLDARVKCVGQSLGGSIPLQMLAKYPYMVEISAFEPPFLIEDLKYSMEANLANAHIQFSALVDELDLNIFPNIDKNKLKTVVSKDTHALKEKLKENNIIVTQLLDFVTKYGTVSPPAQIYHVDTNKKMPKYNKVTDKIYKAVMAGSAMSHAMVLAGQNDKIIHKLDSGLSKRPRQTFSGFLHKLVWNVVNPPIGLYFQLKHFYLNNVHDPKMNPSKSPFFLEKNKEILERELAGKWGVIQNHLTELSTAQAWSDGGHLNHKFQELGRMMQRAEQLQVGAETRDAILNFTIQTPNEKQEIYIKLFKAATAAPDQVNIDKDEIQSSILEKLDNNLNTYTNILQSVTSENQVELSKQLKQSRQQILELYSLLDHGHRLDFISTVKKNIDEHKLLVTNPKNGLLNDMKCRAQSPKEMRQISKLIKLQEKQLLKIPFNKKVQKILNTDLSKAKPETLTLMKVELKTALNSTDDHSLASRILIHKLNSIDTYIQLNPKKQSSPDPKSKKTLLFSAPAHHRTVDLDKDQNATIESSKNRKNTRKL